MINEINNFFFNHLLLQKIKSISVLLHFLVGKSMVLAFELFSVSFFIFCGSTKGYCLIPFFCSPFNLKLYFPYRPYRQGGFIPISTLRAQNRVWYVL